MKPPSTPKNVWSSTAGAFAAASLLCLALYVFVYLTEPFGVPFFGSPDLTWDDFFTNALTILASGLAASLAFLIWKQYAAGEPSSVIWFFLAAGLWLWTLGEILWAAFNLIIVEVPAVSIADLPWLAGYLCFSISLERQYAVIFKPTAQARKRAVYGIWGGILLLSILLGAARNGFQGQAGAFSLILQTFYVVADLTIAVLAFLLAFLFRGGAMLRPWLGLFFFALADGLYAWLYESGLYAFTSEKDNLPSLVADTIYLAAYLILALGLLAHYLLLKFGPSSPPKVRGA